MTPKFFFSQSDSTSHEGPVLPFRSPVPTSVPQVGVPVPSHRRSRLRAPRAVRCTAYASRSCKAPRVLQRARVPCTPSRPHATPCTRVVKPYDTYPRIRQAPTVRKVDARVVDSDLTRATCRRQDSIYGTVIDSFADDVRLVGALQADALGPPHRTGTFAASAVQRFACIP